MSLKIPLQHREGLANLISLSDEEASRLADALATEQPALWPTMLARQVAERSHLNSERVEEILRALISLITTRDRLDFSTEKIVNDIVEAASLEKLGGLEPGSSAVSVFADRLTRLMSLERPLGITSRALDVMIQHKNPLRSSRILSDIRSIFSSGENPQPVAAVIVHNLQLATMTDGEYFTFTAALDAQDLRSLATVVARAIKKEESLKDAIERAGLSYIDVLSVKPPEQFLDDLEE
jgi:hypothetical protein